MPSEHSQLLTLAHLPDCHRPALAGSARSRKECRWTVADKFALPLRKRKRSSASTARRLWPPSSAKGGIAAITRSLAVASAPQSVRVNAIAPSATMTERVKKLVAGNAALTRLADSRLLGLIEPNDIASTALYLASDESRMVTGQVLPVDSGVTIS
ncbi:MAG TPA: SDR family oxidoreductase [Stellaceae bacterium]|nr:SDR family oxidoreductase [Stellaceae bacterium]